MEIEISDANFDEKVIEGSKENLIVVDFWAPWCGPCKMLAPHVEGAVEVLSGVILAKLNVDKSPRTAQKYGVMSIPTVKLFKDGEIIDEFVGVKSEQDIKEWLETHV